MNEINSCYFSSHFFFSPPLFLFSIFLPSIKVEILPRTLRHMTDDSKAFQKSPQNGPRGAVGGPHDQQIEERPRMILN